MDRTEKYNLSQKEQLALIGKALSSELRLRILSELEERAYNVNEIADTGIFGSAACSGS